ncbi:MAG TPA: hypothetical protein VLA09_10630 [Longimicrobiales bacterium]|nr:hypothetical protein [Longimicrobiales bacterium]
MAASARLGRAFVSLAILGAAMPGAPGTVAGQGVRGWVGSTVQMVELRPIEQIAGGCVTDEPCYRALGEEQSLAATQDVSLTAWGFGLQGISGTVLLRNRARLGSDRIWPRTDDRFDAILAYAQLVRGGFTVRAGRQEVRSGLGFSSFDGGRLQWHGSSRAISVEAYGGRSLARGLREPLREALRGIESFVPEQGVLLFGGSARGRLRGLSVTARYQREILDDRSGLASERGSLDLSLLTARGRVLGELDYDFGAERPGKARLTWSNVFGDGRWLVEATALRYVPYFSLSTIWGFFEPVAYHGVEGRVAWSPSSVLGVWASGGWRKYGDTGTTAILRPLEDQGRRASVGARWSLRPDVTAGAGYDLEWGPGGFLSSFDASVRMAVSERLAVTGNVSSFQQIEQYRIGDGRGLGAGVSADAEFTDRITLGAGASLVRHDGGGEGPAGSPWNQTRAWMSARVLVGEDPGLANRRRR